MTDQLLKTRNKPSRSKASQPRYVHLWQRIQQLEEKLLNQESINETIVRQFSKKVRPLEEKGNEILLALTADLMRFFHQNNDNAKRSLLGFWILDNFKDLAAHPFAPVDAVQDLYDEWRLPIQRTDDMVEAQLSLLMASRDDLPGQTRTQSNYPDAGMFAKRRTPKPESNASNDSTSFVNDTGAAYSNEFYEHNESRNRANEANSTCDEEAHSSQHQSGDQNKKRKRATLSSKEEFEKLFDIEQLFRRIARAVHPDREQDEKKKSIKHAIMSDCLQARDNDDIATLLSLYAEHVGDLPLTWSDDSSGELVKALEIQLQNLEIRASRLQSNDSLLQLILGRYLAYDTNDVTRRIEAHEEQLKNENSQLKHQRELLKTDEGFQDALDERRDIELDKLVLSNLTS